MSIMTARPTREEVDNREMARRGMRTCLHFKFSGLVLLLDRQTWAGTSAVAIGMKLSSVPLDDGDDGNESVTIELYENIPISDNDGANIKESSTATPRWFTLRQLLCCCCCFRRGVEFEPLAASGDSR